MIFLRPYGSATTVTFVVRQAGSDAFATSSHWTPSSNDVKLSLDGGLQTNSTNTPTYSNGQWTLSLTAAELQAARTRINIDDLDIIPESILIETYGHASAAYPTAYADQWLGIPQKVTTDHGSGSYVDTGTGLTASDVRDAIGLASANLDTQLGTLAKPGDSMIASNMVNEPLDATEVQQAAEDALTAYDAAKGTDTMDLSPTAVQAVRSDLERSGGVLDTISDNQIDTTDVENATTSALTDYDVAKVSDVSGGGSSGPFIPVVSVDVSVNPWEMVFYDPTDGTTEIDRRALYEVDGTPITSVTQTVGRQLKV